VIGHEPNPPARSRTGSVLIRPNMYRATKARHRTQASRWNRIFASSAYAAAASDDGPVGDDVDRAATESVWDYPRPPIAVPSRERVVIELDGETVADTRRSLRVLETSHPPVYYVPEHAIAPGLLRPVSGRTWCEFKGSASYFDVACPSGRMVPRAAWHYPQPAAGYEALVGHVAFYPGRVDRCTVDDETVVAQHGDFYGGWITSKVTGPFKGAPGTDGW
jgi:uncharacterized protein (DUF427 family)